MMINPSLSLAKTPRLTIRAWWCTSLNPSYSLSLCEKQLCWHTWQNFAVVSPNQRRFDILEGLLGKGIKDWDSASGGARRLESQRSSAWGVKSCCQHQSSIHWHRSTGRCRTSREPKWLPQVASRYTATFMQSHSSILIFGLSFLGGHYIVFHAPRIIFTQKAPED